MMRHRLSACTAPVALVCSIAALIAASGAMAADDAASQAVSRVAANPVVAVESQGAPTAQVVPVGEILTPGETPVPLAPGAVPLTAAPEPAAMTPAAAPPAAVTDPILLAIREQLLKPVKGLEKEDKAALAAYYMARTEGPLWIKAGDFTLAAKAMIAEIANADDWALSAKSYPLPTLATADPAALATAEITLAAAALNYARDASGGRVNPATLSRFNDQRGTFADPDTVLANLAATTEPDAVLRALHPKHPQFVLLREALLKARRGTEAKADAVPVAAPVKLVPSTGPLLKVGKTHPDVALIRDRLAVASAADTEMVYDDTLAAAVKAYQKSQNLKPTGVVNDATRSSLNGAAKVKVAPPADPTREIERIALNMERWRWLPANLGAFHIENNIPEYVTRVFKNGAIVHQEKIIVGKTNTPTSIFSANMQFVIFHPEWGVPDSIKLKEIWPSLRRKVQGDEFFGIGPTVSDTRILQRQNLRVSYNGQVVDASKIDWSTVDPRRYQFIQAAGGANVLGVVKFRFPNRHDIYMHDTPQRDLFAQTTRSFSHGCMRVNNPRRLAEVILAEDKGWTPERVGAQIASSQSLEVKIEKQFPVHVTYFTARVDEDGKLRTFADLYGHDARLQAALAGKPVKLEDPEQTSGDSFAQTAKSQNGVKAASAKPQPGLGGFLDGLFGN